jgi:hypothetical protein
LGGVRGGGPCAGCWEWSLMGSEEERRWIEAGAHVGGLVGWVASGLVALRVLLSVAPAVVEAAAAAAGAGAGTWTTGVMVAFLLGSIAYGLMRVMEMAAALSAAVGGISAAALWQSRRGEGR